MLTSNTACFVSLFFQIINKAINLGNIKVIYINQQKHCVLRNGLRFSRVCNNPNLTSDIRPYVVCFSSPIHLNVHIVKHQPGTQDSDTAENSEHKGKESTDS